MSNKKWWGWHWYEVFVPRNPDIDIWGPTKDLPTYLAPIPIHQRQEIDTLLDQLHLPLSRSYLAIKLDPLILIYQEKIRQDINKLYWYYQFEHIEIYKKAINALQTILSTYPNKSDLAELNQSHHEIQKLMRNMHASNSALGLLTFFGGIFFIAGIVTLFAAPILSIPLLGIAAINLFPMFKFILSNYIFNPSASDRTQKTIVNALDDAPSHAFSRFMNAFCFWNHCCVPGETSLKEEKMSLNR